MFTPGSKPFKIACMSLYGRTIALNDEEVQTVIEVIKERRELVRQYNGRMFQVLVKAFGFDEVEHG